MTILNIATFLFFIGSIYCFVNAYNLASTLCDIAKKGNRMVDILQKHEEYFSEIRQMIEKSRKGRD